MTESVLRAGQQLFYQFSVQRDSEHIQRSEDTATRDSQHVSRTNPISKTLHLRALSINPIKNTHFLNQHKYSSLVHVDGLSTFNTLQQLKISGPSSASIRCLKPKNKTVCCTQKTDLVQFSNMCKSPSNHDKDEEIIKVNSGVNNNPLWLSNYCISISLTLFHIKHIHSQPGLSENMTEQTAVTVCRLFT